MDEERSLIEELREANTDFAERVRDSEINLTYDDEHDMLFITLGAPQEAVMVEVDQRLHYRLDPQTDKIVGMTITAFKKGFLRENPEFRKHFDTVFGKPRRTEAWEIMPRTEASERASDALRGLMPA